MTGTVPERLSVFAKFSATSKAARITPVQAAPISAAVQLNACWQIFGPSPGLPMMLPIGTRTSLKWMRGDTTARWPAVSR